MNIVPISSIMATSGIGRIGNFAPIGGGPNPVEMGLTTPETNKGSSFADFFTNAVTELQELDAIKTEDAYALAVGEADNLAEIAVNAQKYELAVQMMVEVRNKLLDSYSEIMRINI